jgi:hypothetical protein
MSTVVYEGPNSEAPLGRVSFSRYSKSTNNANRMTNKRCAEEPIHFWAVELAECRAAADECTYDDGARGGADEDPAPDGRAIDAII